MHCGLQRGDEIGLATLLLRERHRLIMLSQARRVGPAASSGSQRWPQLRPLGSAGAAAGGLGFPDHLLGDEAIAGEAVGVALPRSSSA